MYICICGAVDERRVRAAIAAGTDNWKTLCHELNIAQQCGICAKGAKEFFETELAKKHLAEAAAGLTAPAVIPDLSAAHVAPAALAAGAIFVEQTPTLVHCATCTCGAAVRSGPCSRSDS